MVDVHSEEYILGQNIRKYRLAKNWTQSDLSNAVDMDRADISKYENGAKGEMGFKTLKRFAEALDVATDQLLNESKDLKNVGGTYNLLNEANQKTINQLMQALLLQQKIAL